MMMIIVVVMIMTTITTIGDLECTVGITWMMIHSMTT
jgi:hypothetical protein